MDIRYPERNFRCPACGAKMPTEQLKAFKPWVCPGCSQEWQFSEMHDVIVQLCLWGLVFIVLYGMGSRGWGLFLLTLFGGLALAIVVAGPLDRVLPRRLEPYKAPFWTQASGAPRGKSVLGLSDEGQNVSGDSQNIESQKQSEPKKPRAPYGTGDPPQSSSDHRYP